MDTQQLRGLHVKGAQPGGTGDLSRTTILSRELERVKSPLDAEVASS